MDFNSNGNGGMVMPVAPAYGGGYGGGFGGDWAWIIILLMCGWGGMGFGGGFGGFGGYDFPWILQGQQNTDNNVNNGFRDQMINNGINSLGDKVVSGFGDMQTSLCSGFAGVNATVNAAANGITNRMYDDTIANMERSFALQGQVAQGFNSTAAGTADLKYTIASKICESEEESEYSSRGMSRAAVPMVFAGHTYDGESYGGEAYGGEAYARGRRNARRDSMGRYSREGGYSREDGYSRGTWDTVDKIEDLIREAPDEQTRQELQRIAGRMRNG